VSQSPKIISIRPTYSALQFRKPKYTRHLLSVKPLGPTRSGNLITLVRPSISRFMVSDRSFYHKAPVIWNSLPAHLRQPATLPPNPISPNTGILASRSSWHSSRPTSRGVYRIPPKLSTGFPGIVLVSAHRHIVDFFCDHIVS